MPAWFVVLLIGIVTWIVIIAVNCSSIWHWWHSGQWQGDRREFLRCAFFGLFEALAYRLYAFARQTNFPAISIAALTILCAGTNLSITLFYGAATGLVSATFSATLLLPFFLSLGRAATSWKNMRSADARQRSELDTVP